MTTIAWDGKTLAVDKASWKNEVWTPVTKLFEVVLCGESMSALCLTHPRIVWAAAGSARNVPVVLEWMRGGGSRPVFMEDDQKTAIGLVVEIDTGRCFGLTGILTLEPYDPGPVSDGMGNEIALGAMLAGASATRAIEIVSMRSCWAAGGVDSFVLPTESGVGSSEPFDVDTSILGRVKTFLSGTTESGGPGCRPGTPPDSARCPR